MTENPPHKKSELRLERLRRALESGRLRRLERLLHALHPAEIALLIESLPQTEREIVWGLVDPEDHGEVLLHVNDEVRSNLIQEMDDDMLLAATEGLEMDDLADLVADLPEAVTQEVLHSMDLENRQRLESVMSYPEDTAGGLMNTDPVTVRPDVNIDVVQRYLRLRGRVPEHTDSLFVVDRYGRYMGVVALQHLLTLDPDLTIAEVMDTQDKPLDVSLTARDVAKRFEDLDLLSAPVVNSDRLLLGRITIDDVVDVIRDEAEHELLSRVGLDEEEDLFAPVRASARRRAIWLGTNLVTAFLAAEVVGLFQNTIHAMVALAVLMPIVPSMGGIAGSQTITLMIRGLALGQIGSGNARALLAKEVTVALINGLLWAVVVGVVAFAWFDNAPIALIMGAAMIINLLNAALTGWGLPLLMRRMGIDPALAGSVVLTTFTDVIGFSAFLGLATLFLAH